jgi:hypothetical protein
MRGAIPLHRLAISNRALRHCDIPGDDHEGDALLSTPAAEFTEARIELDVYIGSELSGGSDATGALTLFEVFFALLKGVSIGSDAL